MSIWPAPQKTRSASSPFLSAGFALCALVLDPSVASAQTVPAAMNEPAAHADGGGAGPPGSAAETIAEESAPNEATSGLTASPTTDDACGDVVLAEFDWATAQLAARLLETALRDGYGCDVSRSPAAVPLALDAVGRANDGILAARLLEQPSVSAPMVVTVDAPRDQAVSRDGVAAGAALYGGGERHGWFVPRWFADANPSLRRLEDLRDQAALFTETSEERPKLHLCPKNWPCHADDQALVAALGLETAFDIVVASSGEALTGSLIKAWRARRPWIGSYWSPSAAVAEQPMTRIDSGSLLLCAKGAAPGEEACRAPHRAAERIVAYPQALGAERPRIAALLRRFSLPEEAMLDALAWRAGSNASLDETVLYVLTRHPKLWRLWLDRAAQKRLEAVIAESQETAPEPIRLLHEGRPMWSDSKRDG